MKKYMVIAVAILASSCQTAPTVAMTWLRTDGRSQVGRPDLQQQFEVDKTICTGEAQKSAVGAPVVYSNGSIVSEVGAAMVLNQQRGALLDVAKGCMAQRGYLYVSKSDAPALAKQFQANRRNENKK